MNDKTKEFIEKARKVHGDKYDYSKVEYVNAYTKICIICTKHGEFYQTPHTHLRGSGCKNCGLEYLSKIRRISSVTTEDFINKSIKIHGDKYNYSKVKYINCNTKVKIICPIHGEFYQTPQSHLRGSGCPKCCGLNKTTEEFIEKAILVHGDKYDYSKTEYKGSITKVCIICPKHGEFWQKPNDHLHGEGCKECSKKYKTTEEFIEESKSIHGDKYDYSKVNYINSNEKVCIICPKHGEFWQTPHSHLRGRGCPKCRQSHLEKLFYNKLTENNIEFETQKRFDWLGLQSLDFYLPKYNIGIECQGEQHFYGFRCFGNKELQIKCIDRDKNKNELCTDNGLKLIYYFDNKFINETKNEIYNNIYNENNVYTDIDIVFDKILNGGI
ncbi:MAG: zinc-ribbon domain-containing protein [Bacilli bacterium]|nr:zinc-ribbon domain-containing protein [Bacilli bacterium]